MRKNSILPLLFVSLFVTSCDNEVDCPGLFDDKFTQYAGSFESYGSELILVSTDNDTLRFGLKSSFTEPYTCHNSYMKECECHADKALRDNLPAGADDFFSLEISSLGFGEDYTYGQLNVRINDFYSYFRLTGDTSKEIEVNRGSQFFSRDTTINAVFHQKVVVANYVEDYPDSYMILSKNKGLVGYRDTTGTTCYRQY